MTGHLHLTLQVICEVGKAVGAEGLVAGQIVDIKSEGMAEQVRFTLHLAWIWVVSTTGW